MTDQFYQIGEVIEGVVTKVQTYGAFLAFENGQSGLLHISEISDKFVRNVHQFCPLGAKFKVKVIDVDEANHFLRLSLKQFPGPEPAGIANKDPKKKREKISDNEIDFSALEKKLPEWIDIVHQRKE